MTMIGRAVGAVTRRLAGVPALLCRCGHSRQAHEHYRRGSDCQHRNCTCAAYSLASLER